MQVSKATSQPADTIWMTNIEKMYARMYAPWRRNAVWLINQDLEPQLAGMAFQASGATSLLPGTNPVPAYLPPGGLSASPYGTLKGRPVVPIEACSAIGDLGDIIFADLSQYWALTKSGGIQTDTSIHLYFDQALTAFRFIFRVNGQPAWSSTITRQNGSSNELSWAVALQAR
jgi:HK97 family phage major capsid protein